MYDLHEELLSGLIDLLAQRVQKGWDTTPWSQSELARRTGLSVRSVHGIFRGRHASTTTWELLIETAMKPPPGQVI